MANRLNIEWKRVPLPENTFDEGKTYENSCTEELSGGQKTEVVLEDSKWIWNFTSVIEDFMKTKTEAYRFSKDGSLTRSVKLHKDELYKEEVMIYVEKNKTVDLYLDYDAQEARLFSNYRIFLEPYSRLNVYRMQHMDKSSIGFFQTLSEIEEHGQLYFYDVQLGAGTKVVTCEAHLNGYQAIAHMEPVYFSHINTGTDVSYTVYHKNKKTDSKILGRGVVREGARKVFRGNLHFAKGSSKSMGREEENCYIFDENVKSDSLPALMCDEDDVVGEHAASIGKFDQNQLFYLMSRGFNESEAKLMLVQAIIDDVLIGHFSQERIEMAHGIIKEFLYDA